MAASTPQPAAKGRAASKASRVRQRMPDSGWVASKPLSSAMPFFASPTTKPNPPPLRFCAGRIAIVISACPARTGSVRGAVPTAESSRSPSMNSSARWFGSAPRSASEISRLRRAKAPVIMAAALPLFFGWVMTSAPARRARVPVSSLDPSSTTMTMSAPGIRLAAVTVAPMRSASFIAGMMAATASGAGFGCALMRSPVRRVRRPGQGHGALRDSARRRSSRGCQWMVSWRDTMPERTRRASVLIGSVVFSASSMRSPNAAMGSSTSSTGVPNSSSQTGMMMPWARK